MRFIALVLANDPDFVYGHQAAQMTRPYSDIYRKFDMKTVFTFLLLLTSIMAYSQSPDEVLIRKLRMESNGAISKKDIKALSEIWMDDIVVVRGSGAQMIGKVGNVETWMKMFTETPTVNFIRNTLEVAVNAKQEMAWEQGEWVGQNTYSKRGKYSAMWRKVGGLWKIQAELFVALD